MTLARETARNAVLMVAARVTSLVISIGAIYFYTRHLSVDEYAFWGILSVLSQTCMIVSDCGLGLAVDRKLPGLLESDPESGRALARSYIFCATCITLVFCAGMALLAPVIAARMVDGKVHASLVIFSLPYVFCIVAHTVLTVLLRGIRRYEVLSACVPLNQIAWTISSIALYSRFGARGFVLGAGLGQLPALIIFSYPLWRFARGVPSATELKRNLKAAWPYHAERYINFGSAYGDQWLVALFMTNELKDIYNVPRTFFDRLTTTLDGMTAVPLTALSTAAGRGLNSLTRGIIVMRRALLYIFALLGVFLFAGSRFLVEVFAGRKYSAGGVIPFRILAIFFTVMGLFVIHTQAVNAAGRSSYRLKTIIFQNAVYLVALYFLAKHFLINGVASARVIGAAALGLATWYYLRKMVTIRPDWHGMRIVALPCLLILIIAGGGQWLYYSWVAAPIWLTAGGLAGGILLLRTIPDYDLHEIARILPRRLLRFMPLRIRSAHIVGECASCGYDLTGNVSGVCPECGFTVAAPAAGPTSAAQPAAIPSERTAPVG